MVIWLFAGVNVCKNQVKITHFIEASCGNSPIIIIINDTLARHEGKQCTVQKIIEKKSRQNDDAGNPARRGHNKVEKHHPEGKNVRRTLHTKRKWLPDIEEKRPP